MCGIMGVISKKKITIDRNILPHRGPDDWGVEYLVIEKSHITLFQSRLSIIGLGKQGHQPFHKHMGKYLIFNGEIYNFKSIKKLLSTEKAIRFETETDTEILYESLVNFGISRTLELLNGMFAFAYFDIEREVVYIVRDHLGIKPVYYYSSNGEFFFSSECKTFFDHLDIQPILNKGILGEYLANGWVYEPNTLFENIKKIRAGHFIKLNLKTCEFYEKEYWNIDTTKRKVSQEDTKFSKIVDLQAVSDVPLGVYFSGGVDSSIVSYSLKNRDLLNLNLDLKDSESARVKLFKDHYGLRIKKLFYQNESLDTYKHLIYYLDEPIADPAVIPAFQLAKKSRELGRIVMLSGMGGDEIDTGYSRHKLLANLIYFKVLRYFPVLYVFLPFTSKKRRRDINRMLSFINNPNPSNYFSLTSYFTKNEITELVGNWYEDYEKRINNLVSRFSGLKKFLALDIVGFLQSHNLIYMDKASMAASVEVRVPLLDKNLAQEYFYDLNKRKYFGKKARLKNILKNMLGNNYFEVKKQGFRYPINKWLKEDVNWEEVKDFFEHRKILNIDNLGKIINKLFSKNLENVDMKLWIIYTLYLWMKTFKVKIR